MPGKFKDIQINHCMFGGTVVNDPVFNEEGCAFITLRSKIVQRQANHQYVENQQDIPLVVLTDGPINVVKIINAERHLVAWCNYMSWVDNNSQTQHGFVVKSFDLGRKPYVPPNT